MRQEVDEPPDRGLHIGLPRPGGRRGKDIGDLQGPVRQGEGEGEGSDRGETAFLSKWNMWKFGFFFGVLGCPLLRGDLQRACEPCRRIREPWAGTAELRQEGSTLPRHTHRVRAETSDLTHDI